MPNPRALGLASGTPGLAGTQIGTDADGNPIIAWPASVELNEVLDPIDGAPADDPDWNDIGGGDESTYATGGGGSSPGNGADSWVSTGAGTISNPDTDLTTPGDKVCSWVQSDDGGTVGFWFGVQDSGNAYYLYLTPDTGGGSVATVDDFEDGDIAEYTGDTAQASATTGSAYEGSYGLALSGGTGYSISSSSGLANYPGVGDTFRFNVHFNGNFDNGRDHQVRFAGSRYAVILATGDNTFLRLWDVANTTALATQSVVFPDNEWIEVEVDWLDGGDMTATAWDAAGNQLAQVTATGTDTTASGGIEYYWTDAGSHTHYFDNFRITNRPEAELRIGKYVNGAGQDFGTATFTPTDPTAWFLLELGWYDDGEMQGSARLDHGTDPLVTVTGNDTDYTSGGVGVEFTEAGQNFDMFQRCGIASSGRYLYSIAGRESGGAHSQTVYFYDRLEDTWTQTTDIPTARRGGGTAVYNGKFYYIGGYDANDTVLAVVEIFDIEAGTWSTGSPMPTARGKLAHEYVPHNGILYVAGGATGRPGPRVATNEAYDLENDTWDTSVADMVEGHTYPLHSVYNGELYYLTGNTDSSTADTGLCQKYDPAADAWTTLTPHPVGVTDGMGDQFNGEYHMIGGHTAGSGASDAHHTYDYENDTWTQIDTLPDTWSHGAAVADPGGIYIYGGARAGQANKGDPDAVYWDGATYDEAPLDMPVGKWNFGSGATNLLAPEQASGGGSGGTGIVDDFEDGGMAEYAGETTNYGVVTAPVFEGSYALEYTGSTNQAVITDTDELHQPAQGDTFRANIRTSSVSEGASAMVWAVQAETGGASLEGYGFRAGFAGGALKLDRYDSGSTGGSRTVLAETAVSYTAGIWYEMEVTWGTDGSMTCRLLDDTGTEVASLSATDATYTGGGVGWLANRGDSTASGYFDYYRVD